MKKNPKVLFLFLIAAGSFVNCNKTDILVKHFFNPASSRYRISKMSGRIYYSEHYDTAVFRYNKAGLPTAIVRGHSGTGSENSYFYYNPSNQLSQVIQVSGQPLFDSASRPRTFMHWKKYFSDRFGRIILDTNYIMGTTVIYDEKTGTFSAGPLNYVSVKYTNYTYDILGRMVRAIEVWRENTNLPGNPEDPYPHLSGDSTVSVSTYRYDANGNCINGSIYDNNINPHTTSWVWMFLDREYSLNNPFHADAYNAKGFPTVMKDGYHFVGLEYMDVKLQYEGVK